MSSAFFLSSWLCGNACQSFDYYGFTIINAACKLISLNLKCILSVLTSYCKMWRLDSELRVRVVVWVCGGFVYMVGKTMNRPEEVPGFDFCA